MTPQTRCVVELADISAVEYECPDCHARVVRRLDGDREPSVPTLCGNCNRMLFVDQSREASDLRALLRLLRGHREAVLPAILRFEISGIDRIAAKQSQ